MTRPTHAALALVAVVGLTLSACGDGSGSPTSSTAEGTASTTSSKTSATTSPTSSASSKSTSSSTPTAKGPEASECVTQVRGAMTQRQKSGQLLMVALTPQAGQSGLDAQIGEGLGNMLYLGGWQGRSTVAAASTHLQQVAPTVDGTKVGMLVAADQEGGEVQQLTGEGFSTMPSGVDQGAMSPSSLTAKSIVWGTELKQAGVNVNLAPVADTVPAEIGRANGPIGQYGREYGSTPAKAGQGAAAFAGGMHAAGVLPTVKHFPGIGRIRGNTDSTASGVSDTTATRSDPYLQPFRDAIKASPSLVMVSNASYPKLDAKNKAPFSTAIITDLLRGDVGFKGVVITDDVGVAAAVSSVPVGQRATRFVAAGGDIVLTADPSQTGTMTDALTSRAESDRAFAAQVDASVTRVLSLKEDMGLLRCG